jgi:hypothetical protein
MQFENLIFARSGRAVRIADAGCPFEKSMVWAACLYMQQYADTWQKLNSQALLVADWFELISTKFVEAMLGHNAAQRTHYVPRRHQQDIFLEMAADVESGLHVPPYLKTNPPAVREYVWLYRSDMKDLCDVPGFNRGMTVLCDFVGMFNRSAMSNFNDSAAVSFAKRVEPRLSVLRTNGSRAANYAAQMVDHFASWKPCDDGCLVLAP